MSVNETELQNTLKDELSVDLLYEQEKEDLKNQLETLQQLRNNLNNTATAYEDFTYELKSAEITMDLPKGNTEDKQTCKGIFYTFKASKGKLALIITNQGNSKSGDFTLGVQHPSGNQTILNLLSLHKEANCDYYIRDISKPGELPIHAEFGVLEVPEGYDANPVLKEKGYSETIVRIGVNPEDRWTKPKLKINFPSDS